MIEKEYKFLLTSQQYDTILNSFTWDESFNQINHYYVDNQKKILDSDITVRIREKDGKYIFQTKIPVTQKGPYVEKCEYEKEIKKAYKKLTSNYYSDLISIEIDELRKVGILKTKRKIAHLEGCSLVIDINTYLNHVDYELEIELDSEEIPSNIINKLTDLCKLSFDKEAKGKNTRFFELHGKKERQRQLKKKRKIDFFVEYTVKKPIFFIIYIIMGLGVLMLFSFKMKVPIYSTYSGQCFEDENNNLIITISQKIDTDRSILIYINQDETIWKADDYIIDENRIIIKRNILDINGKKVFLDVVQNEVTLLNLLLFKGGNK